MNEQASTLQSLQATVKDQQQELVRCRTDMQNTVTHAVTGLQADMAQQLSSQLQGQLEQIQAMFSGSEKKARMN